MACQISLKELTILLSLMGFVLTQSSVLLANQSGPNTGTKQNDNPKEIVEEVVILGSRAKARSSSDSPVPIDVIGAQDFSRTANATDITDNLRTQIPSYSATPWRVLLQHNIVVFSVRVMLVRKAPCAGNGRSPWQARQRGGRASRERPSGWPVSAPGQRCTSWQGLRPLPARRALPGTLTGQLNMTILC